MTSIFKILCHLPKIEAGKLEIRATAIKPDSVIFDMKQIFSKVSGTARGGFTVGSESTS